MDIGVYHWDVFYTQTTNTYFFVLKFTSVKDTNENVLCLYTYIYIFQIPPLNFLTFYSKKDKWFMFYNYLVILVC